MKPAGIHTTPCGGPLRYSISALLIVMLLGLLPAGCGDSTDGRAGDPSNARTHNAQAQQRDNRPPDV